MKNKNGKSAPSNGIGKVAMDRRIEMMTGKGLTSNERSWLACTVNLDQDARDVQARLMASEIFLQTKLIPLVGDRGRIEEAMLVDLLVDFKQSRVDLNVDFEMSQVTANLLNRFQCHLIDDTGTISTALEGDLDLFTSLADLDFLRIDKAVLERLHSG